MHWSRDNYVGVWVIRDRLIEEFVGVEGRVGKICVIPDELLEEIIRESDRYSIIGCYYIHNEIVEDFYRKLCTLWKSNDKALKSGLKVLVDGLNSIRC